MKEIPNNNTIVTMSKIYAFVDDEYWYGKHDTFVTDGGTKYTVRDVVESIGLNPNIPTRVLICTKWGESSKERTKFLSNTKQEFKPTKSDIPISARYSNWIDLRIIEK